MMKNKKSLAFLLTLSSVLLLSSCSLNNFFLKIDPLEYKVLAQKGSSSLALSAYYEEEKLELTDDVDLIESTFKSSNVDNEYQVIFYDGVRGLDLCDEYDNYAYVATLSLGNQQFIPINYDFDPLRSIVNIKEDDPSYKSNLKIFANNEKGSLGYSLKAILPSIEKTGKFTYDVVYDERSDKQLYDYFLNMPKVEFQNFVKENSYDYIVISEPFATRLMTLKSSPLYNQEYDEYTKEGDKVPEKNPDYHYCMSLKQLYRKLFPSDTSNSKYRGVPQTAIFVNKSYYSNNTKKVNNFLKILNKLIFDQYVSYVKYTRLDFFNLSSEYNDPNEDMNSEQTLKAFEYQFDTVGISWNEASRLQAWHPIAGESSNYNNYINRLTYVKSLDDYYTKSHISNYYNFISKDIPSDDNFIEIKL